MKWRHGTKWINTTVTEDAGEIDTTATNTEVPKTFDRVIAENPTDAIAENPMIVMVMVVVDEEGVVEGVVVVTTTMTMVTEAETTMAAVVMGVS